MRKLLPAVAAATALSIGLAPAAAQSQRNTHHERSRSHVSLHLSTHTVLAGNGLAVRGKVRPSGRHRVKVVFRGPDGGVRGVTTKAERDLRPALGAGADRQLRGPRLRRPRPAHPRLRAAPRAS